GRNEGLRGRDGSDDDGLRSQRAKARQRRSNHQQAFLLRRRVAHALRFLVGPRIAVLGLRDMRALFVVCATIAMFAQCKPIEEPINPIVAERSGDASAGNTSPTSAAVVLATNQNNPAAIALD